MSPSNSCHHFEDFHLGQVMTHATPRTITAGDVAIYTALYGGRFAVQSADVFARAIGYATAPVDDLLVFHMVFGKSVPDISRHAVANLGYAECRFLKAVYPGDTLYAASEVIGLKENASGETGIVYVRTQGFNQNDDMILSFARWVMVKKRDGAAPPPVPHVPALAQHVAPEELGAACPSLKLSGWDTTLSGSPQRFADFAVGARLDHQDGMTVEEAEHQLATRLYQNTARVHFNQHTEQAGRFGRRLVYGGHIMSLARALSFNGLANAFHIAAINGGRHVAPVFAGNTIYAWSEVVAKAALPNRTDVGALRLMTRAISNEAGTQYPTAAATAAEAGVVLELDYWVLLPV